MQIDNNKKRKRSVSSSFNNENSVYFEPLKSDDDSIEEEISGDKVTKNQTYRDKRQKTVRFDEEVSVFRIKSFRDYTKTSLKCMYSTSREIRQNAKRNRLEFKADGKDWRKVLEEDAMYTNSNDEYYHPVHVVGLQSFKEDRDKLQERLCDKDDALLFRLALVCDQLGKAHGDVEPMSYSKMLQPLQYTTATKKACPSAQKRGEEKRRRLVTQ